MSKNPILVLCVILICSCSEKGDLEQEREIVSDFDWTIQGDCSTSVLEILFENKSKGADNFLWDFGDGTRSNEINPKKVYSKAGMYDVTLTASSVTESRKTNKDLNIHRNSDGTGPTASLTYKQSSENTRELEFVITTNGSSYRIDFGDGVFQTYSGVQNATHRYAATGVYQVTLTVVNEDGQNCSSLILML